MVEVALPAVEVVLTASNAAVKGMHYIMLAKDFDSDFQPNMVSLRNAELRVCRWRGTVGLTEDELRDKQLLKDSVPKDALEGARKTDVEELDTSNICGPTEESFKRVVKRVTYGLLKFSHIPDPERPEIQDRICIVCDHASV